MCELCLSLCSIGCLTASWYSLFSHGTDNKSKTCLLHGRRDANPLEFPFLLSDASHSHQTPTRSKKERTPNYLLSHTRSIHVPLTPQHGVYVSACCNTRRHRHTYQSREEKERRRRRRGFKLRDQRRSGISFSREKNPDNFLLALNLPNDHHDHV